jgi:hypothetical protein
MTTEQKLNNLLTQYSKACDNFTTAKYALDREEDSEKAADLISDVMNYDKQVHNIRSQIWAITDSHPEFESMVKTEMRSIHGSCK